MNRVYIELDEHGRGQVSFDEEHVHGAWGISGEVIDTPDGKKPHLQLVVMAEIELDNSVEDPEHPGAEWEQGYMPLYRFGKVNPLVFYPVGEENQSNND